MIDMDDKKYFLFLFSLLFCITGFAEQNLHPNLWGGASYLHWWTEDSPISVPLATQNVNPSAFAIIHQPGTQIIFGEGSNNNSFDFGGLNGIKLTLGGW